MIEDKDAASTDTSIRSKELLKSTHLTKIAKETRARNSSPLPRCSGTKEQEEASEKHRFRSGNHIRGTKTQEEAQAAQKKQQKS